MKKLIFLFGFMMVCLSAIAQEVLPEETAGTFIDVTTFTGMMAIVTSIATQVAKLVPYIDAHKWAKVLTALVIGIAATMACWALKVADFIAGYEWWEALVTGVAVGLSAAGFYDVIKALWGIFKKDDEVIRMD